MFASQCGHGRSAAVPSAWPLPEPAREPPSRQAADLVVSPSHRPGGPVGRLAGCGWGGSEDATQEEDGRPVDAAKGAVPGTLSGGGIDQHRSRQRCRRGTAGLVALLPSPLVLKTTARMLIGDQQASTTKRCGRNARLKRGQISESRGLVSIDRSVVAALLSTTPRPRARSSADDFTPPLSHGLDLGYGQRRHSCLPVRARAPVPWLSHARAWWRGGIVASRGRRCTGYRRAA